MAAFTSLALIGAGIMGGKLLSKIGKKGKDDQPLAPGPTTAGDPMGDALQAPKPPTADPGAMVAAAGQAAIKQRKRAAGGSLLTAPKAPKSNAMPVAAAEIPRTLYGS